MSLRKSAGLVLFLSVFVLDGAPANSQALKGKWGGVSSSTLTFLGSNTVKYCFKAQCVTRPYAGNKNGTIHFTWGNARLEFVKKGQFYHGKHTANGRVSTVVMQ